jgi:hypothetical protein
MNWKDCGSKELLPVLRTTVYQHFPEAPKENNEKPRSG